MPHIPKIWTWSLVLVLFTSVLTAQTPSLFSGVGPPDPSGDLPPGLDGLYPVNVDRAALVTAPSSIVVDLPGFGSFTADLEHFEPREGFDADGAPLPGTDPNDMSFLWAGKGAGFDVVLTGLRDCTAGTIVGGDGSWSLMLTEADATPAVEGAVSYTHTLREIGVPAIPTDDPSAQGGARSAPPRRRRVRANASFGPRGFSTKTHPPTPATFVDLMVLYTEPARLAAGGADPVPGESLDTLHVDCIIDNFIDSNNAALLNNGTNVVVRLAHRGLLEGLVATGDSRNDLLSIKTNSSAQDLRKEHAADVVSVLFRSWKELGSCGRAFVQRKDCGDFDPIPGCDVGLRFKDWAYHWAAVDCVRDFLSGSHEWGHNMGGEHDFSLTGIPRDRASFVWSYAYKFPPASEDLFTILVPGGFVGQKVLGFSSSTTLYNGDPIGVPLEADNASTISSLAPVVADFLEPGRIFKDGFETGTLEFWSSVEVSSATTSAKGEIQ